MTDNRPNTAGRHQQDRNPEQETHNLIEPPTRSDESRQAVEHVNNVVLPAAKRRMDLAERRYFNEVGKERSRRTMIYSHNWGVRAGHEHTSEISADAARLAANCGKCRTECRDYDTLVGAILLAVKHHIGSKGSVRSTVTPDSVGWQAAFELYVRTFPEREIPWRDNWTRRSSS